MCGIAGMVVPPGDRVSASLLERMARSLSHRGPDDEGYYIDRLGGCGLGHRRLSIIDLSGGRQPLGSADEQIQAIVNGEIYNFVGIREALEQKGYRFKTKSDCEVVVHGYAEWGREIFRRLDGMFAIALWDAKRRRLFLARDRMGKKPLYYAFVGPKKETLIFGSELRALAMHPALDRRVGGPQLASYLVYECFPEAEAIYEQANKLLPGHVLEYDREGRRAETWPFWELRFDGAPGVPEVREWPEERIAGLLRDRIRDAVEARLISDVPLGVFLSGGLDSSIVAAAMAEIIPPREVKSFSITFEDPSFDEGPYARRVAEHLGTHHHEQRLSPQAMIEILPEVADFMSEPIGDASIIPTYLLSKFARQTVKVALGGDGGDELFLGYPTFQADRIAQLIDSRLSLSASKKLGQALLSAARLLPVSRSNFSLDFKVKRFAQGLGFPPELRHQAWMGSFLPDELPGILSDQVRASALARDPYAIITNFQGKGGARDQADAEVYQYLRLYLMACVLVKVDRASMATGLEVRAPLLDTKVVELAAALPGELKLHGNISKYILKKAAQPWLPREIIERPKKGFGVPVAEWLRGPLREYAAALLAPERLRREGYFSPEGVARLWNEHQSGAADHRKPLWTLLAFQLWLERYGPGGVHLDAPPPRSSLEPPPSSVVLRL
ncbi:MAG: asparagine synthase (glutamine-hydrolyzing) [Deltaproteobacteria bacterium]|nr:asparagine synthase (glutamine-hydrolyzing) [Deltaproteobacteria bacterium]